VVGKRGIVLVENDAGDAELATKALEACGLGDDVLHLRDGVEALDFLFRRGAFAGRVGDQPALVLLDLKMPRLNGLQVLREIKSDPTLKSVPVVVLTSSREERDLAAAYQLGVNAYVVKPIKFQEFVAAMKAVGAFWAHVNEPPPGSVGV
jgi:CheY-like chemotaxis protein